jgi:hypothetical protein
VASVEAHTLHALDAESGAPAWTYVAGGPIDSPPTIAGGRCIFGCADGWVYCLAASDGSLLWRFRGAPLDRRMMAWERLESVWPLHGSVLVLDDVVYCVAGRAAYFDGGLRFLKLDAKTGAKISESVLDMSAPSVSARDRLAINRATLPDILSSDGTHVFMRDAAYDRDWKPVNPAPDHFFSAPGMLDDEYFHRSVWKFGGGRTTRAVLDPGTTGRLPMGRILSFDRNSLYGFGRRVYVIDRPTPIEHELFRLERGAGGAAEKGGGGWPCRWERKLPFHVRALVATGGAVFAAGPPDVLDEVKVFADLYGKARAGFQLPPESAAQDAALRGEKGALLWAVSADKGDTLAEHTLDALPVFDGMAAAHGKLYVSMADGTVRCLTDGGGR